MYCNFKLNPISTLIKQALKIINLRSLAIVKYKARIYIYSISTTQFYRDKSSVSWILQKYPFVDFVKP